MTIEKLMSDRAKDSLYQELAKKVVEEPTIEINPIVDYPNELNWTNIQVDSTTLSIFMSCPQKYEYSMVRHLNPIQGLSVGIRRGSIVHDALLAYWKERIATNDYQIATQKSIKLCQEKLNADTKFDHDFKLNTLQGLLEFLRYIQSSSWIPLEAEKYFKLKIYENQDELLRIFITGRIDLILKSPQIPVFPVDVKTETERWFHSQMSNQFKIYSIACETNLLGVQRVGFQTSLKVEDKFKMETLAFDQDILDEFRTITLPYWVKKLIECHKDNYFPMNTTNCVHGHFNCIYSDGNDHKGICNVSRAVREQKIGRYFVIGEPWEPSEGAT